jgi:basic membrane protein A
MTKKLTIVFAVLMVASLLLSACAPAAAPAAEKKFRIGVVTDVGKIDDKSFNQSSWEGVQKAATELGAEAQYIETADSKDFAKNIATFADEGYNVIVTIGYALGEATIEAAKKYPEIKFIGIDQSQTDTLPNLAGLIFPEDNAGFLVGALAAQISKSGKLGAVCGTDAIPAVWRFGEGFRAGAAYINPDVEVTVVYHSDVGFDKTFTDPEWGKTTAISMIDKGVDVVFGAGGKTGNGALLAAAEKSTADKPVYAIGVDADQYYTVPEAQKVLVSSAMKMITPGVYDLIMLASQDKFPGGNYVGAAGYAPFHDLESAVPAEVKAKLDEIDKGLKDGSIKTNVVPAKPAE